MFLSVFDIFKIGVGPSSSHTMGPMVAAGRFLDDLRGGAEPIPGAGAPAALRVSLHGSLAFTGKGHHSDRAVMLGLLGARPETLDPDAAEAMLAALHRGRRLTPDALPPLAFDPARDLVFDYGPPLPGHANGMIFEAFDAAGRACHRQTYYSVGGGFVQTDAELAAPPAAASQDPLPYAFTSAAELLRLGARSGLSIAQMARANEEALGRARIDAEIDTIWQAMDACIDRGFAQEGELPGGLRVRRRARALYQSLTEQRFSNRQLPHVANEWLSAYATALNEENGGQVWQSEFAAASIAKSLAGLRSARNNLTAAMGKARDSASKLGSSERPELVYAALQAEMERLTSELERLTIAEADKSSGLKN